MSPSFRSVIAQYLVSAKRSGAFFHSRLALTRVCIQITASTHRQYQLSFSVLITGEPLMCSIKDFGLDNYMSYGQPVRNCTALLAPLLVSHFVLPLRLISFAAF